MSKPIGKSSSVNPSGTNDAKTHGNSSKMGNLLAGMLEAEHPDFKKVVSRYMNRAGFDTTSSTAHPGQFDLGCRSAAAALCALQLFGRPSHLRQPRVGFHHAPRVRRAAI